MEKTSTPRDSTLMQMTKFGIAALEKAHHGNRGARPMSFQAYIDNIKSKTGLSPSDFKKRAEEKGFLKKGELKPETKAGEIIKWLKDDFGLGHGHAMAIFATFKGKE
jgi:Domain of unknown function (DUF4287)